MNVSIQQFRDAMVIVETYCNQIPKKYSAKQKTEIGCRVKLSAWGIEMQGKSKSKLVGTVVDWRQWMHYPNQGTVTVKWDGVAKPSSMDISQIDTLKPLPSPPVNKQD